MTGQLLIALTLTVLIELGVLWLLMERRYRVVYGVSFLVLSFLCSCLSSKVVAKENTEGSKGVETLKYKEPADFTKAGVSVISIDTDYININTEYFRELGTESLDILLK